MLITSILCYRRTVKTVSLRYSCIHLVYTAKQILTRGSDSCDALQLEAARPRRRASHCYPNTFSDQFCFVVEFGRRSCPCSQTWVDRTRPTLNFGRKLHITVAPKVCLRFPICFSICTAQQNALNKCEFCPNIALFHRVKVREALANSLSQLIVEDLGSSHL